MGESSRPLGRLKLSRAMLGRLLDAEGGSAPEGGLKAGIESDSARLEATERLGDAMLLRFAASSSNCSISTDFACGHPIHISCACVACPCPNTCDSACGSTSL